MKPDRFPECQNIQNMSEDDQNSLNAREKPKNETHVANENASLPIALLQLGVVYRELGEEDLVLFLGECPLEHLVSFSRRQWWIGELDERPERRVVEVVDMG
jgi:hypothetical protein